MHDNAYAGLLVDDAHWAFGSEADSQFADPLAGVDTTVPEGVDAAELARSCLALGDDALVMAQRLAEWCGRAPDLEEDVALANIALDLLGQARLLLSRAAAADPGVMPPGSATQPGGHVPAEDRLAFWRDAGEFRNVRLVELPWTDFADAVVRVLLVSTWRHALLTRLAGHADPVLAAVAAKGVKEVAYHRDFAAGWVMTLARGTEESRRRTVAALDRLWPWWGEALAAEPEVTESAAADLAAELAAAGLDGPGTPPLAGAGSRAGRQGLHTEGLSLLLAEMQVVARAHPDGRW